MRKVLITILLILLIVLAYFTIFQGISVGTFSVPSVKDIVEANSNLTKNIEEVNQKIKVQQKEKNDELYESVESLSKSKKDYYKVANVSTDKEISKANTEEIYTYEFLSLKVGRHARKEGVIMKMDVLTDDDGDSTVKDLKFTLEGKYYGIIDFVSALEEDSDLNFRIENFNLVQVGENLQATFDVSNIRIKIEETTQSVSTENNTKTNANTNTDTDTNTNTVKQ